MVTIKNRAKAVKVLKAYGMPDIRLFPGFNHVDMSKEELKPYVSSRAAKGVIKDHLEMVNSETLLPEEHEEAKAAMLKNEEMNKAQKTIKTQQKKIEKLSDKMEKMEGLKEENKDLKETLAKMEKEIADLQKVMFTTKGKKK